MDQLRRMMSGRKTEEREHRGTPIVPALLLHNIPRWQYAVPWVPIHIDPIDIT